MQTWKDLVDEIGGLLGGDGSRELAEAMAIVLDESGRLTFDQTDGYRIDLKFSDGSLANEREWLGYLQAADARLIPHNGGK